MSLKYHKIFTHDHINAREISEVYTSDSSDHGRLFILLELPKNKIEQQPVVDELINQIATYFDTSGQDDPENLLEEILQQTNQILPELSTAVKIRQWLNSLDLCIGIIHQNNVFLASIGNIYGLLVHSNQSTSILSQNITINPTKAFSDIVSGQLDEGDVLTVSTSSLFDYISKEKIKQIVSKYSPSAAAIKINELLETVPDFVTFNSLIIKNSSAVEKDINPEEARQRAAQQQELDIKTSDTIDAPTTTDRQKPSAEPRTKLVLDVSGFKNISFIQRIKQILSLAGLFFKIFASIFVYIYRKIKIAYLFLFSDTYRRNKEEQTIDTIKQISDKKYYWFKNLSAKKKIAVISLFIIILIFVQSLVFLTQQKADEDKNKTYNEALVTIEQKFSEADAKLIYNDEQTAENILIEVEEILASLRANSPDQQDQIDELEETTFHKLNKIRHIHEVDSPMELFDLSTTLTTAQDIVQKNGIFYILGDNKLFELKDGTLSELFNFAGGQVINALTDWPDKNKIVLSSLNATNELSYLIFDLDKKQVTGQLEQSANNTSVEELAIYGNNLYVLDTQNNQIFKYPESGNSFAGGQAWIKKEADISNTSSFTIDGSIYAIANDGQIKNFLKGEPQDFDYHQPRPLIGNNAIIKTFRDSDYLYIIDPNNKRVIVLTKEGAIKDQYTSLKFGALLDLAVDPDEKAIYLLNGNHLYLLAINQ